MKVQSAVIKLVLWKSKTLADGTNPIVLCIRWNGQKIKSTGYSVLPNHWNEKTETVKKGCQNYAAINEFITKMKTDAINKKLEFERKQEPYTAEMLLEKKDLTPTNKYFQQIYKQMVLDRKLDYKRALSLDTAYNSLCAFMEKKNILITEITDDILIQYTTQLSTKIKTNTIVNYVNTLFAVFGYANENGIIDTFPNKARAFLKKHYKREIHHRSLTEQDIEKLRYHWQDKQMAGEDMFSIHSKGFSLTLFLLSYTCFGLAPIDLLKLKKTQIQEVEIRGLTYYQIDTVRSKTKKPLRIFALKDIAEMFFAPLLAKEGDYFIPILDGTETPKELTKKTRNINEVVNRNLKLYAEELNIPKFTLYAARHSFASIQVHNGTSLGLIAQSMGRNISGIETYIKQLNSDEDLTRLAF